MTVAIACGGTGGHFYPGLEVAREINSRGGRAVLFIGGQHQPQQLDLAASHGIEAIAVPAPRLPSAHWKYPWFSLALAQALWATGRQLRRHRVDGALGMGSFASVPLGFAAALLRVPLLLHEGNAVPGRANRLLSRWAKALMLSFPLRPPRTTRARQELVGMPVRAAVREAAVAPVAPCPREWYEEVGLSPSLPTLLCFGGSQGAAAVNHLLAAAVTRRPAAANAEFQLIHLTGQEDNSGLVDTYAQAGLRAWVAEREEHIEQCYRAAGLVFCRAGASTITELALFCKPALLMPYPDATDRHQDANAELAVEAGAAVLLPEADTRPEDLAAHLEAWLQTPEEWRSRGQRFSALSYPRAAPDIVDTIATTVGR